jgi:hypothetical protein
MKNFSAFSIDMGSWGRGLFPLRAESFESEFFLSRVKALEVWSAGFLFLRERYS